MYKGIDVLKFVCSLLVVYIHTYCFEPGWGWIKNILSPIAVPFFFISSGFFLYKGLARKREDQKDYIKKYVKRVSTMYILWTVITLPVMWINLSIVHADYTWYLKIVYIVRCFFLVGGLGVYWYLLALIYNSIILYYAYRWRLEIYLTLLSILLFAVGVAYNAGFLIDTILYNIIHISFGSERNFLMTGLLYMCIGSLVSKSQIQNSVRNRFLWLVFVLLLFFFRTLTSSPLVCSCYQLPAAVFLFLFGINWMPQISDKVSVRLRRWSTIIYLSHFPFILLFDFFLKRGTLIDFTFTLLFCFIFYLTLRSILPKVYINKIFGL